MNQHAPLKPIDVDAHRFGMSPLAWVGMVAVGGGYIAMHWEILRRSVSFSKDPNWSHILIVPLIAAYYIGQHKKELQAVPRRTFWPALPLVLVGLYAYIFWIYPGQSNMFRGYSAVFTLGAMLWFILGGYAMRVLWFPVVYLMFGVKISDSIWSRIAESLQDIAALGATVCLEVLAVFMNFSVSNQGNSIELSFMRDGQWVSEALNVAEACSGLRMLMAFIALGVAMAFLFPRPWWQRILMIGITVPVAVAINIGRVTVIGLIYTWNREYAQGDFHVFVGLLMLIPAAGLFMLLGWIMNQIIVFDETDSVDEKECISSVAKGINLVAGKEGHIEEVKGSRRLVAGLLLGVLLAVITAGTYGMVFNVFSRIQVIEVVPSGLSSVCLVCGALGIAVLLWALPRMAPAAAGVAFGVAVMVGLLGTSAVGQYSVLAWQRAVLFKKEVAPRHALARIPLEVGPYHFVQDLPISPEEVEALGTEEFISRIYKQSMPDGGDRLIRLHVTYYTGMVDTVPHVPDRCFVASGVEAVQLASQMLELDSKVFVDQPEGAVAVSSLRSPVVRPGADPRLVFVPQRLIETTRFTYQSKRGTGPEHVSYFFSANGKFIASPYKVRANGVNIRDEYSYYAKIEVALVGVSDPDEVAKGTADFLDAFFPDILACLPDWNDVEAGFWPPSDVVE